MVAVLSGACQRAPAPEPGRDAEPSAPARARPKPTPGAGEPESAETASTPGGELSLAPVPDPLIADRTWSARSANGFAEVRQTVLREGGALRCQSTATLSPPHEEPVVVWTWATCLATRAQLTFVSPDAQRVLVIDPLPSPLPEGWRDVEVATLYAHGVRMKGLRAGAVVQTLPAPGDPPARFPWVKGQEGKAPRYDSGGAAVELETVEGKPLRLGFSGEGFPSSSEEDGVFVAAAGMYRYEDAGKTTHFVSRLDEVPARYRSRAVRVNSQVTVVPAKVSLAGEEPAPATPPAPVPPGTAQAPAGGPAPAPGTLKEAQVPTPKELLDRARTTVDKANQVQRDNEKWMDSLR